MKKRFLTLIFTVTAMLFCIFGLSACDGETKNEEPNAGLSFKTLSVDGTDVYGKVSNDTETFSFLEEVTAYGLSKFTVALDIYGAQPVATKTIPLKVGDNTAYVIETLDGDPVTVYTVTVRRRPMYTVSFETNGGTAVQSQRVEEDGLATAPETTPKRLGYTLEKWNYDFSQSVTGTLRITAKWQANTDTNYRVEYYLQNLENDYYTLQSSETENLTGTTDTTATAEIKTFPHFTYKAGSTESGNINGDGSTVLKVYYTRNTYTVTFDGNGGTLTSGSKSQTVKHGGSVIAPAYKKTGYTFNGYDKTNFTDIIESFTVTAKWTINQYTLNIVYGNGQENKVITQDYNTPIESIANPERAGYNFAGWNKTMPTNMPAENITITAKWNAIFTLSDGTVTGLTDYGNNNFTKLNIPSNIDGVTITAIGGSAFEYCSSLTSVTIGNSVTSIGSSAFRGCSSLEEITIPFVGANKTASATSQYPFGYIFGTSSYTGGTAVKQYYTSSTTYDTYYIPSSLRKVTVTGGNILYGAFYNCSNLTSMTIGNSVTSIGTQAFAHCRSLTSVTIGNGVTNIGENAFYNCSSLTSITIPNSVTIIGTQAFYGCSSLTRATIGNGITRIVDFAFIQCESLTSVTIGNSVTCIGTQAFWGCTSLTNITVPDSVTSIGTQAFAHCRSLTSVTIGNGVTNIGEDAFYNCRSLTSVTIPNSVTSIGKDAFSNTAYYNNENNWENGVLYIGKHLIKVKNILSDAYTIKDETLIIANYAFENCSSLTSVTIPDSVTSIGNYAFIGCSGLTSVTIENSATIGNNEMSIGSYAFYNCSSITSVAIGNSVTSIGNSAFAYCRKLTNVTIPNSVTSIDTQAFNNCSGLTSMTIGNSVTSIGNYAFYGCESLTRITFSDTSTWYCTTSSTAWNKKSGGTQTDLTDGSENATYFTSTYYNYYWYKK